MESKPAPSELISIVVPVLDERESLEELGNALLRVAGRHGLELEAIFVDDGSQDDSWEKIRRLAAADPRLRGIRFRRNFGKAAALAAGFDAAQGQVVLQMDADLQDDPQEIPRFLAKLKPWVEPTGNIRPNVRPLRARIFLFHFLDRFHLPLMSLFPFGAPCPFLK